MIDLNDMSLVKEIFPYKIVMDEGRVVADGPTMEILDDGELLMAHGVEKL